MALDPHYVLMQDIQQAFIDKDTGLPLANGEVWFRPDNNRNALKPVYQLSGAPPNYTYSAMPNPINLSAVGTIADNNNNDVAIYYLPYSNVNPDEIELYYIQVFREGEGPNGVPQLTREAWPNITSADDPGASQSGSVSNEISNSQFVEVLFDASEPLTITYSGNGTTSVEIAPGWVLDIGHVSGGTVTVERTPRAANQSTPTNPPYILEIVGGNNIATLELRQRMTHNPGIWSPIVPNSAGYVSAGMLIGPGSPQTQIFYRASNGTQTTLLTATNLTGNYVYFTNTAQLAPSDNPADGDDGYIDIIISLNPLGTTLISSVQIAGVDTNVTLPYQQDTVNRQEDYLSHYYKPQLAYKPIPSYLVGWDFPLNPSQFYVNGTRAAQAIGANKSEYKWDQTIVFQSVDSGVGVTRNATTGGITLTAALTGSFALVQYLEEAQAREILQGRASVYVSGLTSANTYTGTVTLWATTDPTLPVVTAGTNNSLVTGLSGNGFPACANGNWTQVPRSKLGNAEFDLTTTVSEHTFNGWALNGAAPQNTATFFAIVVGFESITTPDAITINAIGLCAGDIATRPTPKTKSETLLDCQRHFWKTFPTNSTPAQSFGAGTGYISWQAVFNGNTLYTMSYPAELRANPNIVFYNPFAANAFARDQTAAADCSTTAAFTNTATNATKILSINAGRVGIAAGNVMSVHATSDARLGIV